MKIRHTDTMAAQILTAAQMDQPVRHFRGKVIATGSHTADVLPVGGTDVWRAIQVVGALPAVGVMVDVIDNNGNYAIYGR